jgi:glutathione-regulated potassium-efflux system ancillary protein KefC
LAQLDKMAPLWKDEDKLIAAAKQGRQQLEELFAQERGAAARKQVKAGWSGKEDGKSGSCALPPSPSPF